MPHSVVILTCRSNEILPLPATLADSDLLINRNNALLCRLFKAETGATPGAAIRRARLANACKLLAEDRYQIADIAKRCGFSSPSDFGRVFRAEFNQTPSDYLKSLHRLG
jgi:AraC-like DNA-binding protein